MTLYENIVGARSRTSAGEIAALVVGSLLLTISAKVSIPFFPVPLSMQTLVVIGLGLFLGPVRATLAVLFYLAQGAAGLPVFAGTPQQGIGLAYIAGPTGGFLIGFALQAFVAGALFRAGAGRTIWTSVAAAIVAAAAVYPTGLLWLGLVVGFDKPVLAMGLFPFIPGDLMKAALAALLFAAAFRAMPKRENG